jgi:hypothetical protein
MNDVTTKFSLSLTAEQLVDVVFARDEDACDELVTTSDGREEDIMPLGLDYIRMHVVSVANGDDGKSIFLFYVEVLIRALIRLFGDIESRAVNIDSISDASFYERIVLPFQEKLGVLPILKPADGHETLDDTVAELCQFKRDAPDGYSYEEYGVLLRRECGPHVLKFASHVPR